ncbi:UDP-N-acetylmuramoyl-tripeptide--D-alanyl-D-alanine ligase [Deferribacter thermophilus]|uniref:UDP-N-acetylmuramoyl-tripeptide--D-alanyl-D- alanine ligase n=1 Tax=Deferribacter thermophilus TaxID=53573 RepID=UPI003C146518
MKTLNIKEAFNNLLDFIAPSVVEYNNVVLNSKDVSKGDIFLAMKGENVDGNSFYKEAYERGALITIFDNPYFYNKASINKILVENSFDAIKSFGKWKLQKSLAKRVVITGSVGKTTTKKMLYEIFTKQYQSSMSYKNYNNELGIAISCANIPDEVDYVFFEIGTNSKGEIKKYSEYLKPEVAVVTKIATSHIGRFGSVEEIAKEKFSIAEVDSVKELWINEEDFRFINDEILKDKKLFIVGYGDDADLKIDFVRDIEKGYEFCIKFNNKSYVFKINHIFKHFILNASIAIGIALNEGVEYEFIYEALQEFQPEEKRGLIYQNDKNIVIDDTYNASYDSITAALESLDKLECSGKKKFAIIGEIAEIEGFEDEIYSKLITFSKTLKDVNVLFCGDYFEKYQDEKNIRFFKNKQKLYKFLEQLNSGCFLVKASRSKKFEEIVDYLTNKSRGKNVI